MLRFIRYHGHLLTLVLVAVVISVPLLIAEVNVFHAHGIRMMVATATLIFVLGLVIYGRDFFLEYWWKVISAVVVLYFVAFLSMQVMRLPPEGGAGTTSEIQPKGRYDSFVDVSTPGTVLVLFLAVITVLGFTITISKLQETHIRISSYDRFLRRLDFLLTDILKQRSSFLKWPKWMQKEGGSQIEVKVLCSVPTLGNVSHQELFFERVYWAWLKIAADEMIAVDMVALDPSTPSEFKESDFLPPRKHGLGRRYERLAEFEGNDARNTVRDQILDMSEVGQFYTALKESRRFQQSEIRRAATQAVEILRALSEPDVNNSLLYYQLGAPKQPPFHMFWTNARAIIAVPLDRDLPTPSKSKVVMIGYETSDPEVLERLREVFSEWKKIMSQKPSPSRTGETVQEEAAA